MNKCVLSGRLGNKPEVRTVGDATCVNFRMAVNETWTSNGERKERTDWFSVDVWGKLGDVCARYLDKGRFVIVEGKLRTSTTGEGDQRRTFFNIRADQVEFGPDGGKGREEGGEESGYSTASVDDIPF